MKLKRFDELNEDKYDEPSHFSKYKDDSPESEMADKDEEFNLTRYKKNGHNEKVYSEEEVVHLIMELAMDTLGEEWIAEEDDNFKRWLESRGLLETWKKIFGDDES